jgi:hypothetical protein
MQGAQKLRSEAHLKVRCNDEVEAQRSRWTFYKTITINIEWIPLQCLPENLPPGSLLPKHQEISYGGAQSRLSFQKQRFKTGGQVPLSLAFSKILR